MKKNALDLTIRFVGPPAEGEAVRFDEFINFCQSIYKALGEIERCVAPDSKKLIYRVVGLEIGSAGATLSPQRPKRGPDRRKDVMTTFRETCRSLQRMEKKLDPRIDRDAFEAVRKVGIPLRKGTTIDEKRAIQIDGIYLTSDFLATLDKVLDEVDTSYGSVSGVLEDVRTHNRSEFVIYPNLHNESIKCTFDESLIDFETIRAAIRRTVTVYGRMHYSHTKPFPIRVDVEAGGLEIHPLDEDLPSLNSMAGRMTHNDIDSVALVRAIRDQYD